MRLKVWYTARMEKITLALKGKTCTVLGHAAAGLCLIEPAGAEEEDFLIEEYERIAEQTRVPFRLVSVPVEDWNRELPPWDAPGLKKSEPFTGGGLNTLSFITDTLLPALGNVQRACLLGYSLSGLFALWACRETDVFSGAAGVSPSLWFPGWAEYAGNHPPRCPHVYVSLGDTEEKARHPVLKTVGDACRAEEQRLTRQGIENTLVWNTGNHFNDPAGRLAKAAAWLIEKNSK